MNLLDAVVTKVLGKPEQKYGYWFVKVEYNCYGVRSRGEVMVSSEEEANNIKEGYTFQT